MKPLILITNDDGINSPGLQAAAEAVKTIGEILVVAPHIQQTGMSRSFPKNNDIGIIEKIHMKIDKGINPFFAVHGSPAQAVAHGILEIAPRLPDLCISGVNYGENVGGTIFISGTVGATMEASSYGIPSLAISIGAKSSELYKHPFCIKDWYVIMHFVRKFTSIILKYGLPQNVALWNINIPLDASENTEIRVTCQSRQNYYICSKPEKRKFKNSLNLPIKVDIDYSTLEIDSDIYAINVDNVISVTPVGKDLSVHDAFDTISQMVNDSDKE